MIRSPVLHRLLLAAGLLLLAAPGFPSPPPGVSLIEGHLAPFFHNQPLSAFRVYAFHGPTPGPIPFQVDERDPRDRWIVSHGPKAKHDTPAEVFDANDAIVVMNRDLGQQGNPSALPDHAEGWAEVQIGEGPDRLGFVYVGIFAPPHAPAAATQVYARYDPATDRVYAERYALALNAPLPTHFAPVERLGDFGTNTIAGMKAEAEARLLAGLLRFRRTEAGLRSDLRGYRPGPVRVIRQARYWVPLPLGMRTSGRVNLLFYRDFIEGSARIKLKIPPRLVMADGEFTTYFDFLDRHGAHPPPSGSGPPAIMDGLPDRWAPLRLPSGRTLVLIPRLEDGLAELEQHAYYGGYALPHFGFQFSEIGRLESGSHRISVFGLLLDSTDPDTLDRAADLFLSPPPVSVRLLQAPPD